MRQPETCVAVYAIKVTLLGARPPVWSRILVPLEITLRNLHLTLQPVMGWTNSHLHQFCLPVTPVSGLAILSLNSSLQMMLTDDFAAGNTDTHNLIDDR